MDTQQGLTHQNHGAPSPSSVDSSANGPAHDPAATLVVHGHPHADPSAGAVNVPEAMKAHVEALQAGDVKPLVHVDPSVGGEVAPSLASYGLPMHDADYSTGYPQGGFLTSPQSAEDFVKQKKHKEDKELSQKRRKQKEEKRVVKAFIKVATVPTVPLPSVKSPIPGDPTGVSVKAAETAQDMEWKQQTLRPLDKQQLYNLFEKHVRLKDVASSVFWKYVLNSVYKNKQIFKTTRPNGLRCLTGVQFRCSLHDDKVREDIKPYVEKLEKYLIFGVDALLNEIEALSKSSPEKPKHGNTGKKKRKRGDHSDKGDDDKKDKKKNNLNNSSDSINTPTGMDETVITGEGSTAITSIFEVMQLLSNPNISRAMKILAAGTDLTEAEKEVAMAGISTDEMIGLEKLMNLQMLLQQQHQLMPLLQQLQQLQLQQLQQQQQLVEQQQAMAAAEQHVGVHVDHNGALPATTTTTTESEAPTLPSAVEVPPQ